MTDRLQELIDRHEIHQVLLGDEAHTKTYYHFIGVRRGPVHFISSGRYVDYLQRRDGQWRIASRATVIEGAFNLPTAAAMPAPANNPPPIQLPARDRSDVSYARPLRPRQPVGG